MEPDFIAWVDAELRADRALAERAVGRIEALRDIYAHAAVVASELTRPVTAADVFRSDDEMEAARLRVLADRIAEPACQCQVSRQ